VPLGLGFLLGSARLALVAGRVPRLSRAVSALGCALGGGRLPLFAGLARRMAVVRRLLPLLWAIVR
jgi:hypothetical protein